jgi:DNA-binding NarL/FixJ family response regulator
MAAVTGNGRILERDRELASLDTLIGEAAAGEARLALVEGPAGIGKTTLMVEARRRAGEAGMRTLAARGSELERQFPFGVVRQLFEPLLVDARQRKQVLGGAAATAATVFEAPTEADSELSGDGSFAVLHGLYWMTVNLSADGPLLLSVDDLHWCDRPSLRFLLYLTRRLEGLPALVAGSLRPDEPGADAALLGELAGDPSTVSLYPGALSPAGVTEVVRSRLGEDVDEAFAAACHDATGGNPLLLGELLKSIAAEGTAPTAANVSTVKEIGPRAVSRAVVVRLARLPEDAVAVARALAVLGDGAELPAVAALAGLDDESAARATGALARAEVLRHEMPLGFVHPLVRAAVYRDISPGERELQHEQAAQILSHAEVAPERIASHLLAIPPRGEPEVAEVLEKAGQVAMQKGAAESAVAYLQRALDEPPRAGRRAELLLELGVAEVLTNGPAASVHLQQAYEALQDPQRKGMAGFLAARTMVFTGEPDAGAALARKVASELPDELADLRMALEAVEPMGGVNGGTFDESIMVGLRQWRTNSPGKGPGAKMLQAITAYEWMVTDGSADDCSTLALEALEAGVLIEADQGLFPVVAALVLAAADRDEALESFDVQMADAHRRGATFGALGVYLWRGYSLLRRGELAEAEQSLKTAEVQSRVWGSDTGPIAAYHHAFMASAQVEMGKLEDARASVDSYVGPHDDSNGVNFLRWSTIEVLLAEGKNEDALVAAEDYERHAANLANPTWAAWRALKAQALDRLGRTDEAIALAKDEVAAARRFGAPGTVGRSLTVLGRLKRDKGLPELEEAVALLESSSARLAYAKALTALGAALRRARKPSDSREPLRRALELADSCGAGALAEEVRSELYASGARPRTSALSGVEALTASEKRVAGLAAGGQTNRDIAQSLFVTPKTVEVHLSNAYRKLGIRSRRELPGAMAA